MRSFESSNAHGNGADLSPIFGLYRTCYAAKSRAWHIAAAAFLASIGAHVVYDTVNPTDNDFDTLVYTMNHESDATSLSSASLALRFQIEQGLEALRRSRDAAGNSVLAKLIQCEIDHVSAWIEKDQKAERKAERKEGR